ncbi:MAG: tetratricopeptide repeat protein [Bacteroidota bacterium]
MKKGFSYFAFLLTPLFFNVFGYAQINKLDSLQNELKKNINDTSKINVFNALGIENRKINTTLAFKYLEDALILSEKINFQKGRANAYSGMAIVHSSQKNSELALSNYTKSLLIRDRIGDQKGAVTNLNSIGNLYINQGDYEKALIHYLKALKICVATANQESMPLNNIAAAYFYMGKHQQALEYYIKALKTFEKLGNKKLMINPSLGVGNVYKAIGEYRNALTYYKRAMTISEEVKDEPGLARSLTTIGIIYEKLENNDTALIYYNEALIINQKLKEKPAIALSLINIGNIYFAKKNYDKALEYYKRALVINQKIGDKNGSARSLLNIGILYSEKENIELAMDYLKKGLILADSINSKEMLTEGNEELSEVYEKKGDYKNAYAYYRIHSAIKDSLLNEGNSKNMAEMQTKYESDKKEKDIELLKKEQSLQDVELENQKNVRNGFIVGCLLLVLIIILAYNRYRIKQRASEDIKQKNKEITESISYAKRIQSSFLTSEKYIAQRLSDYFIFYNPRNIVSGDFYWLMEKKGYLYICTADCTGHGIPGAFMSLISMGILNEIIYSKEHLQHTDEILNELRRIIILAVNPEGSEEEGKDGMDAVLCRFNFQKMELEYSAANNSFYIIRNGELLVYKPDKMPVGKHIGLEKPFSKTTIALQKGDCVYTFSDGFADQFGGPNGKKFQSKRVKELLLAHCHKPMKIQREIIGKTIEEWQGTNEQVDDMLVIGIRV